MRKIIKIHFLEDVEDEITRILAQQLDPQFEISYGEKCPPKSDFEILISGIPTEDDLKASPNLKRLIIPWAGLPQRTARILENFPDLKIHNLHYNAPIVAENAVALMLAVLKKITVIDRDFRTHNWSNRYLPLNPILLQNKKVTLLGYGAIAKEIEKRLAGWDVSITRIKRTKSEQSETIDQLDKILTSTDILFITLPHTNRTTGIIDKKRLAMLPDKATVINLARGPVLDEEAIYNELKSKRLLAGLDVWYNYPKNKEERQHCPPSQFNFSELDNVVMTPHMAGHSDKSDEYLAYALAEMLNQIAAGNDNINRVELEKGY